MSYTEKMGQGDLWVANVPLATTTAGVLRAIDIGASSADHGEILFVKKAKIHRLRFTLTEELGGGTSVAPQVVFTKRPTPLGSGSEAVVGTVIVPDATPIGSTVYKDVDIDMAAGDSLEISWVIGTGTPTGIGLWSIECSCSPEEPGNNSEEIASA